MLWAEQGGVRAVQLVGLRPPLGTVDGECVIPWEKVSRPPRLGDCCTLSPRVPSLGRAACGDSNLHVNKYLILFKYSK